MDIKIKSLEKAYGNEVIYHDFSIVFPENKITGIMGPSGSGKTTLLNLLAGVTAPDSGMIEGVEDGKISYIFQEDRLLPWRTVKQNLLFVLDKEKEAVVASILEMVGLADYADYYPKALSGGMRQRVSIARAFCYPSTLLLMDEPFSSLDFELKDRLTEDFKRLWQLDPKTVIYVSHNRDELTKICDSIYRLKEKPVKLEKIT
ncbi:ABC transporter ATP-binding protein [Eubacterium sp. 1001713B170207_170306_E7]|uniref:ABC transporter ATP-binding protein n=1 Tax=Eubacterium sp. 1001713B170207_170306_E7 TaxID=2787097 RepID=UPI001897181B|nr:ABC transporter ATP-binding protein [Eubacterium sp. 1001713B170207_170306_E7]